MPLFSIMKSLAPALYVLMVYFIEESMQDNTTDCASAICTQGKRKIQTLMCHQGTLLIQNVTGNSDQKDDLIAFMNLRRMCMGKSSCDVSSFCQRTPQALRISYRCLNDSSPQCSSIQKDLYTPSGIIRNNDYPSMDHTECSIRIVVPEQYKVTITIHDLEKFTTTSECDGGILLRTRRACSGFGFPGQKICAMHRNFTSFAACGDVDIRVSSSFRGLRYLITYAIMPQDSPPSFEYLEDLSHSCPEGLSATPKDSLTHRRMYPVQGVVLDLPHEMNGFFNPRNVTYVTIPLTYERTITVGYTERTVFYIALAVAAISLTGLIVVTVICVRRQRQYKSGSYMIEISRALSSKDSTSTFSSRPSCTLSHMATTRDDIQPMACLQEGYSVVADQIPYSHSANDLRSPAYAEVADNVQNIGMFRFGSEARDSARKSAENVYSEMNAPEKNVYHEIPDEYPQWRCPTLFTKDYKQLMRNRELRRQNKENEKNDENDRQKKSGSPNTTYVTFNNNNRNRLSSRELSASQRSDSESSLVLMENEVYESFQSAHV